MKPNTTFTISLATALLLAQSINPSWGASFYNPTTSDFLRNTAVGSGSILLLNSTGTDNTGVGYAALNKTTGSANTAVGSYSLLRNTSGFGNTASGRYALTYNTTGNYNMAFGLNALLLNSSGSGNTAVGLSALSNNTTSSYNTALGYKALQYKTSGSYNLALGQSAGINLTTGNNNIYLSNVGTATESSTIRIGNSINHTRAFISGIRGIKTGVANAVAVVIDSNGQLGTIKSAQRFKKDIHDMNDASRGLLVLRPVTYHYKQPSEDGSNPLDYGLIAEEVAKVYPDLVAYGADGKVETVQYHKLTPMLINEVQRLNTLLQVEKAKNVAQAENTKIHEQKITLQEKEIDSLRQQMATLQTQAQRIEALTSRLSRIEAKESLGMAEKNAVAQRQNPG